MTFSWARWFRYSGRNESGWKTSVPLCLLLTLGPIPTEPHHLLRRSKTPGQTGQHDARACVWNQH